MRFLLIEDDMHKTQHIIDHISSTFGNKISVDKVRSYQSGLEAIMTQTYDLVLLDMSLPNYDLSPTEDGYRFDAFAGRNILSEMKRKNKKTRVVVITQYVTLGDGADRMTLQELRDQLSREYPDSYRGAVYYSSSETNWKDSLNDFIKLLCCQS